MLLVMNNDKNDEKDASTVDFTVGLLCLVNGVNELRK